MFFWAVVAVVIVWALAKSSAVSGGESGGGSNVKAIDAEPSPEVLSAITSVCAAYGVPMYFGLANAAMESRFKPNAGLYTLGRTDLVGAIPERSIGLEQVNVNPNTPTGRARIAKIRGIMGGVGDDAAVVAWLKQPANNVGFWCAHIVLPLVTRADREGYTGDNKWYAVRVWLASGGYRPDTGGGLEMVTKFRPVLAKWKERMAGL